MPGPRALPFCTCLLLAMACARTIEIPPPRVAPSAPIPPLPSSAIDLLVEVDLDAVAFALAETLPDRFERTLERRLTNDLAAAISVELDIGALELEAIGDEVVATARIRYAASACVRTGLSPCLHVAGCGDGQEAPEVELHLRSRLSWAPSWSLTSATEVDLHHLRPCEITVLQIDVDPLVDELLQPVQDRLAARFDAALPHLTDVRCVADRLWHRLRDPVELRPGLWLALHPDSIRVTPLRGRGEVLEVGLSIRAQPELSVAARPARDPERELPPLEIGTMSRSFHMVADGRIPLRILNTALERALVGEEIKAGPWPAAIRAAELRAVEGSDAPVMRIEMDVLRPLLRDMHVVLWAVTELRYSPAEEKVLLDHFDFTIESKRILVRSVEWLLDDRVAEVLRGRIEKALARELEQAAPKIGERLTGALAPGIDLEVEVEDIEPRGVIVRDDALVARVGVRGRARLEIQPLPHHPSKADVSQEHGRPGGIASLCQRLHED